MSKRQLHSSAFRAGDGLRWGLSLALALGLGALWGQWFAPARAPLEASGRLALVRIAQPSGAPADMAETAETAARASAPPRPARQKPNAPPEEPERNPPAPAPAARSRAARLEAEPAWLQEPGAIPKMPPGLPPRRDGTRPAQPPPQGAEAPSSEKRQTPPAAESRNGGDSSRTDGAKAPAWLEERAKSAPVPRTVRPEQLDRGFGPLAPVRPSYPARAERLGRGGEVRVEVAVGANGRVRRVTVLRESGAWGFGAAVRSAYRAARFSRPTVGGRPVRVLWRQTLVFRP